ncbi:DUF2243 domain-containing protein [Cryobacterium sp. TMS1-13-1]|uniref:DUF2243 domain-containing protein n=1 Tax=Cryobacterium sp. TMS1-13-1 TaxID=1259220 RepID=UPI00106C6302|nr:DUF2243 domain-containing protein [Cryobacterium sp. TMS1-13-1]TFD20275.1 DUF2243 domain-containing protein [Cryobacterium sp. TMS1-13-1]
MTNGWNRKAIVSAKLVTISTPIGGTRAQPRGIGLPGTILGIGLGEFVDGSLLHQILQWHHMLPSAATETETETINIGSYPADTAPGLQMNTLWDGFFHTIAWLAVPIRLGMLGRPVHQAPRRRQRLGGRPPPIARFVLALSALMTRSG